MWDYFSAAPYSTEFPGSVDMEGKQITKIYGLLGISGSSPFKTPKPGWTLISTCTRVHLEGVMEAEGAT